jgi:hypothetical protein
MSYQDSPSWKDQEINKLTKHLSSVVDSCLHNLNEEDLTLIQDKMGLLVKQQMFWIETENPERFIYDLRNFLLWLCDFVEVKENEFFGNE